MKYFILSTLTLFVISFAPNAYAEAQSPKLYAVSYHADWCGSCKMIGPQVEKARGKADLDNHSVLFVKMDLTNKTTSNQSALMASSLGLGDAFTLNNGKTGYVALIDATTKEEVARFTKENKADDIISTITEKLKS